MNFWEQAFGGIPAVLDADGGGVDGGRRGGAECVWAEGFQVKKISFLKILWRDFILVC